MPHVELPQAEFKVVLLGDSSIGKTCLALRFAEGHYRDSARNPTVGAFFITKKLTVNIPRDGRTTQDENVEPSPITAKLQIWDTAGQEQFKKLAPMYYKDASAAIICYDVTSPKSFQTLEFWMDELRQNVSPENNLVIALCATKCDLAMNPDTSQAEALAAATGSMFMTTSAKTNTNVSSLFQRVAERVLQIKFGGPGSAPPLNLENDQDPYKNGGVPSTNGVSLNNNVESNSRILHSTKNGINNNSSSLDPLQKKMRDGNVISAKTNRKNGSDALNESIEEHNGVVEGIESGESNDSHYSRCGGLMSCDVSGSSTDNGSACIIQ